MFQRLRTTLAQVKAGNTSENLPHEIKIIYSLQQAKKALYNYITIQWVQQKFNTKNEYYISEFSKQ